MTLRTFLVAIAMFASIEIAAANVDHGDYDPDRYASPIATERVEQ